MGLVVRGIGMLVAVWPWVEEACATLCAVCHMIVLAVVLAVAGHIAAKEAAQIGICHDVCVCVCVCVYVCLFVCCVVVDQSKKNEKLKQNNNTPHTHQQIYYNCWDDEYQTNTLCTLNTKRETRYCAR